MMATRLTTILALSTALLAPLGACTDTGDGDGELEEVSGPDVEKDDGSRQLAIFDVLSWEGRDDRTTKVFKTAEAFEDYFGVAAPAEVDFDNEWAIYFAVGDRPTGGYHANVTRVLLSATGKTLTITGEEVSPSNDCIVTQARTSPATLVTIRKQGPATTRYQTRRKGLSLACSAVCGDDLAANLEYGSRGAYYYSESDEDYIPVAFDGIGDAELTKELVLEMLDRPADTNIDQTPFADWIADQTGVGAEPDEVDQELAAEMNELGLMIELHLTDVSVFDVGFEDNGDGVRPLYIIGKDSCGELAGYKTLIVAT